MSTIQAWLDIIAEVGFVESYKISRIRGSCGNNDYLVGKAKGVDPQVVLPNCAGQRNCVLERLRQTRDWGSSQLIGSFCFGWVLPWRTPAVAQRTIVDN